MPLKINQGIFILLKVLPNLNIKIRLIGRGYARRYYEFAISLIILNIALFNFSNFSMSIE